MNGEHPTGFWLCRLAQTKMKRKFSGHMRPTRTFFEYLINALKLLANQQKDGDILIQNIIVGLEEKYKERTANGLRSFVTSDNYSAVEMGHLRRGQRPSRVVKLKMSGDSLEVLREGTDALTLRAEDFDSLKACINMDHIGENFGSRPWWIQIAKQFTKELNEMSGKSCTIIAET